METLCHVVHIITLVQLVNVDLLAIAVLLDMHLVSMTLGIIHTGIV